MGTDLWGVKLEHNRGLKKLPGLGASWIGSPTLDLIYYTSLVVSSLGNGIDKLRIISIINRQSRNIHPFNISLYPSFTSQLQRDPSCTA